jgi:putative membrane protein
MRPPNARWPHWVYATGDEPDYRFSLANERTFLAWIRTALALLAGAVALEVLDPDLPAAARRLLGGLLVASGTLVAASAWLRWAAAERAIRRGEPLPALGTGLAVTLTVLLPSLVVLVAVLGGRA